MPSLLESIGLIGKGITAGSDFRRQQTRDRIFEQEAARDEEENDRLNRERLAIRRSLSGLFDQGRQEIAGEDAASLRSAGQTIESTPVQGFAAAGLPFAAAGLKGAADEIENRAKKPTAFDPDVPFEKLVDIQDRQRESRGRLANQRTTQRRLETESKSRNQARDQQNADRVRSRGDTEILRSELIRLADAGDIALSSDAIRGLSEKAVDDLAKQSGLGGLRVRDRTAIDANRANLRGREEDEKDVPRPRANDVLARIPAEQRNDPTIQRWLTSLQRAESAAEIAIQQRDGLLAGGTRQIGAGGEGLDANASRSGTTLADLNTVITQQRQVINDLWRQAPPVVTQSLTLTPPARTTGTAVGTPAQPGAAPEADDDLTFARTQTVEQLLRARTRMQAAGNAEGVALVNKVLAEKR